jgi:hypothetical protein
VAGVAETVGTAVVAFLALETVWVVDGTARTLGLGAEALSVGHIQVESGLAYRTECGVQTLGTVGQVGRAGSAKAIGCPEEACGTLGTDAVDNLKAVWYMDGAWDTVSVDIRDEALHAGRAEGFAVGEVADSTS